MDESEWTRVEATLMTSEPIPAYGGISISKEALDGAAAALNSGGVPIHVDHDQARPLRIRSVSAWVVTGGDAVHRLRASFEIHKEDLPQMRSRTGMSVSMSEPLSIGASSTMVGPWVELGADHAWFSDRALLEAEAEFVAHGVPESRIRTERIYQFSFVPDPQIFITIVATSLSAALLGTAGSALWDAIKALFRRRKTPHDGDGATLTSVNLKLQDGDRTLTCVVKTIDEVVAQRAIDAFEQIASKAHAPTAAQDQRDMAPPERLRPRTTLLVWDDVARAWIPAGESPPPESDASER